MLKDIRVEGSATLVLKDKRNESFWVEYHNDVEQGASTRSLLHPDHKAPSFHHQITHTELEEILREYEE